MRRQTHLFTSASPHAIKAPEERRLFVLGEGEIAYFRSRDQKISDFKLAYGAVPIRTKQQEK